MDWADDIAYSVHDVEDFYRAGLIPLDRLQDFEQQANKLVDADQSEQKDETDREAVRRSIPFNGATRFLEAVMSSKRIRALAPEPSKVDMRRAFNDVIPLAPATPYDGTRLVRGLLSTWKSDRIRSYVNAIRPAKGDGAFLGIDPEWQRQVALLKELTWFYVINNPQLRHSGSASGQSLSGRFVP